MRATSNDYIAGYICTICLNSCKPRYARVFTNSRLFDCKAGSARSAGYGRDDLAGITKPSVDKGAVCLYVRIHFTIICYTAIVDLILIWLLSSVSPDCVSSNTASSSKTMLGVSGCSKQLSNLISPCS